jgi:hypothetical protein
MSLYREARSCAETRGAMSRFDICPGISDGLQRDIAA